MVRDTKRKADIRICLQKTMFMYDNAALFKLHAYSLEEVPVQRAEWVNTEILLMASVWLGVSRPL